MTLTLLRRFLPEFHRDLENEVRELLEPDAAFADGDFAEAVFAFSARYPAPVQPRSRLLYCFWLEMATTLVLPSRPLAYL